MIDALLSNLCLNELPNLSIKQRVSALFYDIDCLKHRPKKGSHVERPERCSISYQMLSDFGLLQHLKQIKVRQATETELASSHSQKHIARMKANENKRGWYDSDTFFIPESHRAALLAAGACIDLMLGVISEKYANGFALINPFHPTVLRRMVKNHCILGRSGGRG